MAYRRDELDWEEEQDDDQYDEPHLDVQPRRSQGAGEREFRRERSEQFRQFMRPWDDADDGEARQIVMGWAGDAPDEYGLLIAVLRHRFRRVAVEELDGDEVTAEEVFDQTFLELHRKFRTEFFEVEAGQRQEDRTREPLYRGKKQFLALFRQRLVWRCSDALRRRWRHPMLPGGATWAKILGWLLEGEGAAIEDTVPSDTPAPEEVLEEDERRREESERFRDFQTGLRGVLQKTLRVMVQIVEEASGEISRDEIRRRTKETLGITDNAFCIRLHRMKSAYRSLYREPPPTDDGPAKNRKKR